MRPVLFKKWIPAVFPKGANSANQFDLMRYVRQPGTGCWEEGFSEMGLFHQWANAFVESDKGYGNYTVALVEKENGEIVEVLPSNLKFVKP